MTYKTRLGGWMEIIAGKFDDVERRARNRKRTGVISDLDLSKGLARVQLSDTMKTPWIPWKEVAAGGIKTHIPPTIGEQVDVLSESGDLTDGVIDMSVPSNANPRPHDGPEAVITYGGTRIEIADGLVTITADLLIKGSLAIEGDSVTHNGVNIGDSHVHGGVQQGGAKTTQPV